MSFDFDQMVPSDFDVEKLFQNESGSLFGAKRKDVWHFVRTKFDEANSDDGFIMTSIAQQHIPRFLMADAISSLNEFNNITRDDDELGRAITTAQSDLIALYSRGKCSFDLSFFPTENGLPKDFCQLFDEDIEILKVAKSNVVSENGLYVLPKAKSHTGFPVSAKSIKLIQAIAFEKECRKTLKASNFGIYSAFCTWRDFIDGREVNLDTVAEIVVGQLEYDADAYDYGDFMPLAMKVQEVLFRKPIWGEGISINTDEAIEITYEAIKKLSSIQWAQFTLMNGMHEGGLFLPLAQVLGLNSWERYIYWNTEGFQPDSFEEQAVRTETMFIKMLGDLGEDE